MLKTHTLTRKWKCNKHHVGITYFFLKRYLPPIGWMYLTRGGPFFYEVYMGINSGNIDRLIIDHKYVNNEKEAHDWLTNVLKDHPITTTMLLKAMIKTCLSILRYWYKRLSRKNRIIIREEELSLA
jgi:hypothetical protein